MTAFFSILCHDRTVRDTVARYNWFKGHWPDYPDIKSTSSSRGLPDARHVIGVVNQLEYDAATLRLRPEVSITFFEPDDQPDFWLRLNRTLRARKAAK